MPKLLSDYPWKISYSSNTDNTIADFYIPALERTIKYDRKSGFFSSAILSKVARGLGAMLHNQGQIRLIMGCQFSQEDLSAIQQGFEFRDALLSRLDTLKFLVGWLQIIILISKLLFPSKKMVFPNQANNN